MLRSELFPDSEGYVRGTKTIVTYDLDLRSGSASLDAKHPSFSTHQSLLERYEEFFRLGANHLLTGLDHILFLLALIAGSRRLREIVLAASTFTLAHSVTFVLAAAVTWLQVVHRFCVAFGALGLENFGRLGEEIQVDERQRASDRRRALQVILEGSLIGLVVALLVVAITV